MAKRNYKYNTSTLSYEIASIPFKRKLMVWGSWTVIGMVLSTAVILLFSRYFETPKMALLRVQIASLQTKYHAISLYLHEKNDILNTLMYRDNSVYRSIFEVDKIPLSVRESSLTSRRHYAAMLKIPETKPIADVMLLFDKIVKKAYTQSKSYDEISVLAMQKEQMIESIPSIQPVNLSSNRIHISAVFGYRSDPISHHIKMHDGIDFAGPVGTPIYATGNGRIVSAEYNFNGYGNNITINHGFGYKTRYAHLSRMLVHEGDYVKRGTIVGLLGSTGKSTGPHLHYEVIYHNNAVNPVNFFSDDITNYEFNKIIQALQGKVNGGTD